MSQSNIHLDLLLIVPCGILIIMSNIPFSTWIGNAVRSLSDYQLLSHGNVIYVHDQDLLDCLQAGEKQDVIFLLHNTLAGVSNSTSEEMQVKGA